MHRGRMAASQPWPQAVADGGGRGNRRWQMAADGAGWQWTTAKGGSLAVDGGGGVDDGSGSGWRQRKTLNVWVVVTKCSILPGICLCHPFFARGFAHGSRQNNLLMLVFPAYETFIFFPFCRM